MKMTLISAATLTIALILLLTTLQYTREAEQDRKQFFELTGKSRFGLAEQPPRPISVSSKTNTQPTAQKSEARFSR